MKQKRPLARSHRTSGGFSAIFTKFDNHRWEPGREKIADPDFVFETIVVRLFKWPMTEKLTSS